MSERAHALREANANVSTVSSAPDGIRIHVFRGGRAANLGHNHVLTAPRFTGYLAWPAQSSQPPSFELLFRLDELVLDDPDLRRRLGGAYASTLSPAAVDATRNNMLGAGGLNAQRYPWVHIRSMNIVGEGSVRVARVAINLHGQTREQWLVIQMAQDPAGATDQASGSLVLRQTDFGALPFSVGGGLLSIQDELAVVFQVHSP